MEKIVLYYKFVPINDTESVMFWQRALAQKHGLTGRVLISRHGINGTLGGDLQGLKYYTREMKKHSLFDGITWKWSDGGASDFPKLSVRVRDEIVAFEAPDEIIVTKDGIQNGGARLTPTALHALIDRKSSEGSEVIFYDGRNMAEAEIGRFKDAIIPQVKTSKDFRNDIETGEISRHKDKAIVTYCTGGVRCEILTAMMKKRGYKEVYQLDGGIVKYGEKYGDDGYWEGKLYVFDNRMQISFSENARDLAKCYNCGTTTSRQVNSIGARRKLAVCCENCPAPAD